jgi:hypothetical protein
MKEDNKRLGNKLTRKRKRRGKKLDAELGGTKQKERVVAEEN